MPPLILPVPETVTSHYVVATGRPQVDPYTVAPWRVPEPFRTAALEALKTPRMSIAVLDAEESMIDLRALRAPDREREMLKAASHHIVVLHQSQTSEQPFREQAARAVARALADHFGGILVDPHARHVVLRHGHAAAERGWYRMGDQWFGLELTMTADGPRSDAFYDPKATTTCTCLRMDLLGLRRFGLPSLFIAGMPCSTELMLANVLRSVASRLLTDHWEGLRQDPTARALRINDQPTIDQDDFWRFWAATPPVEAGAPTAVRLVPHGTDALEIVPPAKFTGTRATWGIEVLQPAMPPLMSCTADEDVQELAPAGAAE